MDLDLSNNEIEFGLEHTEPLTAILSNPKSTLENLNLSSNQIGDEMIGRLAESLGHKIVLKRLKIDESKLTIRGMSYLFK